MLEGGRDQCERKKAVHQWHDHVIKWIDSGDATKCARPDQVHQVREKIASYIKEWISLKGSSSTLSHSLVWDKSTGLNKSPHKVSTTFLAVCNNRRFVNKPISVIDNAQALLVAWFPLHVDGQKKKKNASCGRFCTQSAICHVPYFQQCLLS